MVTTEAWCRWCGLGFSSSSTVKGGRATVSIDLIRAVISIGLLAIASNAVAQAPQEIRLWPGKAPGSEAWAIPEVTTTSPTGDRTITNVSDPTVTVFLPDAGNATGNAVVVAPGGALRLLGWDNVGGM